MDYKKELNEQQYMAATHKDGPILILAGAGSGKTRVLVYRITYLVEECGVDPSSILAITFTNKAAKEMLERAEKMLNGNLEGMWISTFHSACGRILRSCGSETEYGNNFTIYDDSDVKVVLKRCYENFGIDEKGLPYKLTKSIISDCKNRMIDPQTYAKSGFDPITKNVAKVYEMYQREMKANKAMDFDDMLLETVKLLETHPDICEYYCERFKYIMVDEYQDTNAVQERLITLLAGKRDNVCVVGDDDQSIYSFRGATVDNILTFEKRHKNCVVIKLEQNYRSTQNILDAANAVIHQNENRKEKRLWTSRGTGDLIQRYVGSNNNEEAYYVAREIKNLVERGDFAYSDFAILYRINAISQSIESSLTRMGIPYRVYGGMKYLERAEVKDLIAYLRVCTNLTDNVSLKRIINVPKRGIGATSVEKAEDIASKENVPLFSVLVAAENYPELSKVAPKMKAFATAILEYMVVMDEMKIAEAVEYLIDHSGILTEYENEKTDEAQSRIENIKEFITVAKEYENEKKESGETASVVDFLSTVALSTDMDKDQSGSYVSLMTVHSAKGLEFPCVFITAMEDEIFPSAQAIYEANGLEEERRLCYVAITRAKKRLYITGSEERMIFGQTKKKLPSRFLKEIPEQLLKGSVTERKFGSTSGTISIQGNRNQSAFGASLNTSLRKTPVQQSSFARQVNTVQEIKSAPVIQDLAVGMRVKHLKFGEGTVSKLEGEGDELKAEIIFDNLGMKRLLVKFANLKKL